MGHHQRSRIRRSCLGVVLALLMLNSCSQNESTRGLSRYCWVASEYKLTSDEFFMPLQFKGIIRNITEKANPGRRYVHELSLDFLPQDSSTFSRYRCEQFYLDGTKASFIGMNARMRNWAAIGDTIVKVAGTYKFSLITKNGGSYLTELLSPGWCIDGDCTFERDGSLLCHYH